MQKYDAVKYNLIYVYSIDDAQHKGLLKVGKASFSSSHSVRELAPNDPAMIQAARLRINQETKTAMVPYKLEYTELAVRVITMRDGTKQNEPFADQDIFPILYKAGFQSTRFMDSGRPSEWFRVDLNFVKKAIAAFKAGQRTISGDSSKIKSGPRYPKITLREEQEDCVNKTIEWFKSTSSVLWDCKMRFGKTVTAYELIRRMNEQGKFYKTIVITHRPAVEDGWNSDHDLIFQGRQNHGFIDKTNGKTEFDSAIDAENDRNLEEIAESGKPFVYFASIQDLRGSARVRKGGYNKNNAVFDMDWDLIIIDEAHEGTKTELGDAVITALKKPKTKVLSLSGTPYNLLDDFRGDNTYTWTYVDEQRAKLTWEEKHPWEKNPYEDLPKMNIFTFDLASQLPDSYEFVSEDAAFNFSEFFRTWTGDREKDFREIPEGKNVGDFVHEEDVYRFLSLISEDKPDSNYPFSTDEYRDMFRHTFWIVPGVKEAKALSALIQRHPRFKDVYKVVNIAGEGDEEEPYDEALELVRSAIASYSHTITLSCGKLTTGVTVREWTAIMMLTGSASTSASGYMQAIFRVQSPGSIDGKQKRNCYVFDFAPDRALKVIAGVHRLSYKDDGDEKKKQALGEFLNFCPVISFEGTEMITYDVSKLMKEIKKISIDNAVRSGFDDDSIYKKNIIKGMTEHDQEVLNWLSDVVVPQKKGKKKDTIIINRQGLSAEERKMAEAAQHKPKRLLSKEEKEALEKLKKEKEEESKLRDLLRAVSIRLPMFFYGAEADITKTIRLADFTQSVDDESWKEFMPKGLDKGLFLDILKYYDEDVVVAAGQRIRQLAKQADNMPPTWRTKRIVGLLSLFKNPDKETVLTPWRVVNLHMGLTFGGYSFFNDDYSEEAKEPHLIDNGEPTEEVFLNENTRILEINSKSGSYPLYLANTLYMLNLPKAENEMPFEESKKLWNEIVRDHIFVLCKTQMARRITIRTLVGYTNEPTNAIYLTKLVEERMKDLPRLANKITNPATWGKEGERMKFDAVVGNPPYQLENSGDGNGKEPIYHLFIDLAKLVAVRGSLIHPGRFLLDAGKTPKEWNRKITHDKTFKIVHYYKNSRDIFPTVDIKGGVAISFFDNEKDFSKAGPFCIYPELTPIIEKVRAKSKSSMSEIIYPRDLYRLTDELYKENPDFANRQAKGHKYDVGSNIGELFPELFTEEKPTSRESYARIYTKTKSGRKLFWVKAKYLKLPDNFNSYKVFIPTISGIGNLGEPFGNMYIADKMVGSSATFLSVGHLDTFEEGRNIVKYIFTKFSRVLLSSIKITPHNTRDTWANVPLQDFSSHSDIDWTKPVSEIDRQLYSKYGLSKEEIDFIENNVKPMGVESEYQKELSLNYQDLVHYLLKKYGRAKHDYFTDTSCTMKNSEASRADEGLVCHHIDEDKAIMLSNPEPARKNPFAYQKADRLVYCNILEHLILHVKIVEEQRNPIMNEGEISEIGEAMNFIVKQINDYFGGKELKEEYLIKEMSLIEKDFEDYIEVLQRLWGIIQKSPALSKIYTKQDLAKGLDGNVYENIQEEL